MGGKPRTRGRGRGGVGQGSDAAGVVVEARDEVPQDELRKLAWFVEMSESTNCFKGLRQVAGTWQFPATRPGTILHTGMLILELFHWE